MDRLKLALFTLRRSHFSSVVTCLVSVGESLIVRNAVSRVGIVSAAAVVAVSAVAKAENFILPDVGCQTVRTESIEHRILLVIYPL